MQSQPLTRISLTLCPLHNQPYIKFCSHPKCSQTRIRVCSNCFPDHSSHQKYVVSKQLAVNDLQSGLRRCFQKITEYDVKVKEFKVFLSSTQKVAKKQYSEMQINVINSLKKDKEILQQKYMKMQTIHGQIQQKQRLSKYFIRLKEKNLLELRIKLSSLVGMKNFRQKNEKFCSSMQRSNKDGVNKLYDQFNKEYDGFMKFLKDNGTFRLGQMVKLKNSKKKMESSIKNGNNNNNNGNNVVNNINNNNVNNNNVNRNNMNANNYAGSNNNIKVMYNNYANNNNNNNNNNNSNNNNSNNCNNNINKQNNKNFNNNNQYNQPSNIIPHQQPQFQNILYAKQRQRSKTQTNFGQNIINGILRFFNR